MKTSKLIKRARKYESQVGPAHGATSAALKRLVAASKETGYLDTASATYALDTTGTVTLLNGVQQGVAVTQRIGKKILMKSLQGRGRMLNGTTATSNDVAWMIVYDKRPNGNLPAINDILVSTSSQAMNNDNNAGRFSILKRCDAMMIGTATLPTETSAVSTDFYLDLKKHEVVYKAFQSGAINDIEQGALYLVTVGQNTAGTTAASLVETFRLRFFDA